MSEGDSAALRLYEKPGFLQHSNTFHSKRIAKDFFPPLRRPM
jgi:hypothetical protein